MTEPDRDKHEAVERREMMIVLPPIKVPRMFQGFIEFVREQGVVGLAIGLVLGTAAKSLIDSLVQNIFNPIIGLLYGGGEFGTKYVCLRHNSLGQCSNKLGYGGFVNELISFVIVAAVVYFIVHRLKLDRIDKKKVDAK